MDLGEGGVADRSPGHECGRHFAGAGRAVSFEWRGQLRGERLPSFGLPVPGQELVQAGLRHLGDAIEDIGEPGLGVDVVELGRADQG